MIGQATAHRRANAFAQAVADAELDGVREETAGGHGTGTDGSAGPAGPAGTTAPGGTPGAPGSADARGPGGHGAHAGHGGHGAHGTHGSHAADRHADPEQVSMVALAAALSQRPRPAMDPEAKTVQRAQLIAAMEQAIADGSFRPTAADRVPEQRAESPGGHRGLRKLTPRSRLSRRLAVGGLTMGVAAGAFGGVAAASTNALPGDSLYGLKRGMEDLKLDMAGSDASRGQGLPRHGLHPHAGGPPADGPRPRRHARRRVGRRGPQGAVRHEPGSRRGPPAAQRGVPQGRLAPADGDAQLLRRVAPPGLGRPARQAAQPAHRRLRPGHLGVRRHKPRGRPALPAAARRRALPHRAWRRLRRRHRRAPPAARPAAPRPPRRRPADRPARTAGSARRPSRPARCPAD